MAKYQPETTVFIAFTGLDDHNKTVHTSMNEFIAWAMTKKRGEIIENASFQRLEGGWYVRIPHDLVSYELLISCDTICINNGNDYGGYWYTALIDTVEWKNEGCSYVYFHIDWYSTLLGTVDYENTWAYIEREHVKKDWNGSNPEFSNMGVDEGFGTTPDTPINAYNHQYTFTQARVMAYTPYDDDGKPNFEGKMENGIYTAMYRKTMTVSECNEYLKKIAESDTADLAMIPSIVSIPDIVVNGGGNNKIVHPLPWLDHVSAVTIPNNSKCWSGEFCQIKLMSGTGGSVSMNPQWFGSNKSTYEVDVNFFFNGGDGGFTASFVGTNGTYQKEVYNDFTVSLSGLPQAVWVGDAYAQWKAANLNGYAISQVAGAIGTIYSSVHALSQPLSKGATQDMVDWKAQSSLVGGAVSIGQQIGGIMQTIGNAKTSGTVLGGANNADVNTATALGKYGFQIVTYLCQNYIMKAVDSFFDRYGYKVNVLKQLDRRARPKWTFIKCHEVHLLGGNMPSVARNYIQTILCQGVTFWRNPDKIGDFSDPAGNKGV